MQPNLAQHVAGCAKTDHVPFPTCIAERAVSTSSCADADGFFCCARLAVEVSKQETISPLMHFTGSAFYSITIKTKDARESLPVLVLPLFASQRRIVLFHLRIGDEADKLTPVLQDAQTSRGDPARRRVVAGRMIIC